MDKLIKAACSRITDQSVRQHKLIGVFGESHYLSFMRFCGFNNLLDMK